MMTTADEIKQMETVIEHSQRQIAQTRQVMERSRMIVRDANNASPTRSD